jgi:hypothetical protein
VLAPIYDWTGFYIRGHIGGAFETYDIGNGFVNSGDRSISILVGKKWGCSPRSSIENVRRLS